MKIRNAIAVLVTLYSIHVKSTTCDSVMTAKSKVAKYHSSFAKIETRYIKESPFPSFSNLRRRKMATFYYSFKVRVAVRTSDCDKNESKLLLEWDSNRTVITLFSFSPKFIFSITINKITICRSNLFSRTTQLKVAIALWEERPVYNENHWPFRKC